jgi:hypothetical protein
MSISRNLKKLRCKLVLMQIHKPVDTALDLGLSFLLSRKWRKGESCSFDIPGVGQLLVSR